MSVKDMWSNQDRWHVFRKSPESWKVVPPFDLYFYGSVDVTEHPTFPEAHAAYLDAVTCEAVTPFKAYTEPRCTRAREHKGGHRFKGLNGCRVITDLEQMPK